MANSLSFKRLHNTFQKKKNAQRPTSTQRNLSETNILITCLPTTSLIDKYSPIPVFTATCFSATTYILLLPPWCILCLGVPHRYLTFPLRPWQSVQVPFPLIPVEHSSSQPRVQKPMSRCIFFCLIKDMICQGQFWYKQMQV